MADLTGMTLSERMNTINGDGKADYTYNEALNRRLRAMGTHNGVNYSGISYTKYTTSEALNIIYKNADINSMTGQEVLNSMISGNTDLRKYTEQEALNMLGDLSTFNAGIP